MLSGCGSGVITFLQKGRALGIREAVPWGWVRFVCSYLRGKQLRGRFYMKPLPFAGWLEADSRETCLINNNDIFYK